jgi:hypothetical protein
MCTLEGGIPVCRQLPLCYTKDGEKQSCCLPCRVCPNCLEGFNLPRLEPATVESNGWVHEPLAIE